MDTVAGTSTGAPSGRFVEQQGGHFKVGSVDGSADHKLTQDFLIVGSQSVQFKANGDDAILRFVFSLDTIRTQLNSVALFQTYKVNSVSMLAYNPRYTGFSPANRQAFPDDLVVAIAPYSRDTTNYSAGDINPMFLPGSEMRIFKGQMRSDWNNWQGTNGSLLTSQEFPDDGPLEVLKVVNDNPQYEIQSSQFGDPDAGRVFSSGHLQIWSRTGTAGIPTFDSTQWNVFVGYLQGTVARSVARQIDLYLVSKVNITFEGLRWGGTVGLPGVESTKPTTPSYSISIGESNASEEAPVAPDSPPQTPEGAEGAGGEGEDETDVGPLALSPIAVRGLQYMLRETRKHDTKGTKVGNKRSSTQANLSNLPPDAKRS